MLLSIVECGNYRDFKTNESAAVEVQSFLDLEIIGPVVGVNVAVMRNIGAQQAQGRWIFFKDQDCNVDADKLYLFVKEMDQKKKSWGAIGGVYQTHRKTILAKAYHWIQRSWVHRGLSCSRQEHIRAAQHLLGGALLVNKEAFFQVGGFNEKIGWGGEEVDLTTRFLKKGFLTGASSRIRVEHNNTLGLLGFCKRAWYQNFHGKFYSLQGHGHQASHDKWRCLIAPLRISPCVWLFFSVAFIASCCGLLFRALSLSPADSGALSPISPDSSGARLSAYR